MKNELALLGGNPVIEKELTAFNRIGKEESDQITKVLDSGELSGFVGAWCDGFNGGRAVQEFEKIFSEVIGCEYAISVNSNTTGIIASLGAIGLSPGDEVIIPPYTMSATAVAPLFYGGIPVFADIEQDYFCLDVEAVKQQINEKTKAIIAVNLFGHPAELRKLKKLADEKNIYLIEDNAQAPLAKENGIFTGTIGHIGVFSFNRHKHIQTGEGGVCVTNDESLSTKLKIIRNHGENIIDDLAINNITNLIGFNFRMTELNAAIGIAQMKKSKEIISERVNIAKKISDGLSNLDGIVPAKVRTGCEHVYYLLAFRYDENVVGVSREIFAKALTAEGFTNSQGYVKPLYYLPVFRKKIAIGNMGYPFTLSNRKYNDFLCPVAERMYEKELIEFFICSYDPDKNQVDKLIEAFNKVYKFREKLKKFK